MVCLFQLHALCRRPAQPVGRSFDYRYGLAAKPATSRLFGEIRPVLVADFRLLGLYDVYASAWFVVIMMFLVISTGLCLIRNVPPFLREIRSFRENAKEKSLAAMRHSIVLDGQVTPEVAQRYLEVQGYGCKTVTREDGSVLVAAKKGAMNKWGYIFAHAALIVICLGGLIDSNILLKIGMLTGQVVPDNTAVLCQRL